MSRLTIIGKFMARFISNIIIIGTCCFLLARSDISMGNPIESIRRYTRNEEFDYVTWVITALDQKMLQSSLDISKFMQKDESISIIEQYLEQVEIVRNLETGIQVIYADPQVEDPASASAEKQAQLTIEEQKLLDLAALSEPILQNQVNDIIREMGLSLGGQSAPPIAYRVSELPLNLVTSSRTEIKRIVDISLNPGLAVEEMDSLETAIYEQLDLSALVVPVGGIGAYPTMVMQTTDLRWLVEVIAHEWIHNYLTFQPLGFNYETSPDMTTINETVASIAGEEISLEVLRNYYPELVPPETAPVTSAPQAETAQDPPAFDFRAEMRITRVKVDELLAEGKVSEAEQYMEERRQFFRQNGYLIRKLNQAYFVFYGSYNDQPGGGASGNDPVGPLVQELRKTTNNLAEFVTLIARVNSYPELVNLVQSRR